MTGTKDGGRQVAKTIISRYGLDYYSNIGKKGGSVKGVKKGFAANRELASRAGAIGGTISRRNKLLT